MKSIILLHMKTYLDIKECQKGCGNFFGMSNILINDDVCLRQGCPLSSFIFMLS